MWTAEELYVVAERAHALLAQGRYEDAAILFEGLAALDPADSYYRHGLAGAALALGHPEAAVREMDQVLRREPGDGAAHARRCEALLDLGRGPEAAQELDWLAGARPDAVYQRLRLRWRALSDKILAQPRNLERRPTITGA